MGDGTGKHVLVMTRGLAKILPDLDPDWRISYASDDDFTEKLAAGSGRGIEAIITSGMDQIDAAMLGQLPDLKLISVCAAGYSGIDVAAASARGIAVTNGANLNNEEVAEYAVLMLLAHRRKLMDHDAYVRADKWKERRARPTRSISTERVGIVGLGNIGIAIAERLVPFGCEIRWWGPRPKDSKWVRMDSLLELAQWSSVLIVAARGDESTIKLIDRQTLEALGPDGLIVNIGRGFMIDEAEMKAALVDGRLGGAALDVFEDEPIAGSEWADIPNVLMAPHVAGATRESLERVLNGSVDNVIRLFAGKPLLNRVN